MARSDFFGGGGSGFSSTKASNNTCSSCFHSLAEIGDLKKARPMISSENGFHGGSPEAHQQFWPKTFGSQLGRMKKKTKQKNLPSTHTLQKVGEKIIQSNHHPILFFVSDTHCFSFFSCWCCWTLHLKSDCFLCEKSWSDYLRDRAFDNISTRSMNLVKHPLKTTRDVKTETKHTSPFCSTEPKKITVNWFPFLCFNFSGNSLPSSFNSLPPKKKKKKSWHTDSFYVTRVKTASWRPYANGGGWKVNVIFRFHVSFPWW